MMANALKTKLRKAAMLACNRFKSEQGETLTETLVSLLIGGLALLMLAVVIATATRMISGSRDTMNEYYADSNTIALASNAGGGTAVSGTVQLLDSGNTAIAIKAGEATAPTSVTFYIGDVAGKPVVSYSASESTTPNTPPETGDDNG